jgi:hypothetical protein
LTVIFLFFWSSACCAFARLLGLLLEAASTSAHACTCAHACTDLSCTTRDTINFSHPSSSLEPLHEVRLAGTGLLLCHCEELLASVERLRGRFWYNGSPLLLLPANRKASKGFSSPAADILHFWSKNVKERWTIRRKSPYGSLLGAERSAS